MAIFKGSKFTYIAVFTANIIGFMSGTSLSWSSPVLRKLQSSDAAKSSPLGRKITADEASWIGSLTSLGSVFGPILFPYILEKLGRRKSVSLLGIPFASAYFIAAFAKSVELLYVARVLMGIGVGGVFTVLPVFIVEVAEDRNRGLLTATTTSFIFGGTLFANALGPYVSIMAFDLVLAAISVLFVPLSYWVVPETPYYLAKRSEVGGAKESLRFLRRKESKDLEEELVEIRSTIEGATEPGSFLDIFLTRASRKAFGLCVALTTFQQFSGILVILAYTQDIFAAANTDIAPEISTIIVGVVQFGTCFITPVFSDIVGRRRLLLVSITGGTISLTVLGLYFFLKDDRKNVENIYWLPLVCLVLFILSYNFGMGSLPWAMMAELLPQEVIAATSSVTTSVYWVFGFALTKWFGALSEAIGIGPSFWIFAGCCVLFDAFVLVFVFETKGRNLREIQEILGR